MTLSFQKCQLIAETCTLIVVSGGGMPGLSRALEPAHGQGGVWTLLLLFLGTHSEHPPSKLPTFKGS